MTSLTLNLSIFLVILASICLSAPVMQDTTMKSVFLPTIETFPLVSGDKNRTLVKSTFTNTSSVDKESEADESRETREVRILSGMNASKSPMFVTEKSNLSTTRDLKFDHLLTSTLSFFDQTTETLSSTVQMTPREIPEEFDTTTKIISGSTWKLGKEEVNHVEEQNEPLEEVETTSKSSRRMKKKPVEHEEEEEKIPSTDEVTKDVSLTEAIEEKKVFRIAEYDPKALDSFGILETGRMQYDENNQSVSLELTTMNIHEENLIEETTIDQQTKILDQAQESSIPEEEKSNH